MKKVESACGDFYTCKCNIAYTSCRHHTVTLASDRLGQKPGSSTYIRVVKPQANCLTSLFISILFI